MFRVARLCDPAVCFRAERIELKQLELDAGHAAVDRRQHRIDRHGGLRRELGAPERVEVLRPGCREPDLGRRDCRPDGVEPFIASSVPPVNRPAAEGADGVSSSKAWTAT